MRRRPSTNTFSTSATARMAPPDMNAPASLSLNINDPRRPRVIGQIGPPHEGMPSQTSREVRVWPEKKLLIVMNFACSTLIQLRCLNELAALHDPVLQQISDPTYARTQQAQGVVRVHILR